METRARYVLIGLFTLAVIAAGFGFAYWLSRAGGLGERAEYRTRFTSSVSGLDLGSPVLFNGIRAGEVTGLSLSRTDPTEVVATIAILAETPIRTDSTIGLEYGGLTGTASVSLEGGTEGSPAPHGADGEAPLLVADSDASRDWTRSASKTFALASQILSENAETLHAAIGNINTFAEALARNSARVDKIAAGLERMTGAGAAAPATTYDLVAPTAFPPGLARPPFQLLVAEPTAVASLQTQRFITGDDRAETLAFEGAKWSDSVPIMFRAKILESFENAGYLRAGDESGDMASDRRLETDLRTFRTSGGEDPRAEVAFMSKIIDAEGRIIEARRFRATAPVETPDAAGAAAALNRAFSDAAVELVS